MANSLGQKEERRRIERPSSPRCAPSPSHGRQDNGLARIKSGACCNAGFRPCLPPLRVKLRRTPARENIAGLLSIAAVLLHRAKLRVVHHHIPEAKGRCCIDRYLDRASIDRYLVERSIGKPSCVSSTKSQRPIGSLRIWCRRCCSWFLQFAAWSLRVPRGPRAQPFASWSGGVFHRSQGWRDCSSTIEGLFRFAQHGCRASQLGSAKYRASSSVDRY